MRVEIENKVSDVFVQLLVSSALEMLKKNKNSCRLTKYPEFEIFISEKEEDKYYLDLTPYLQVKGVHVYVRMLSRPTNMDQHSKFKIN